VLGCVNRSTPDELQQRKGLSVWVLIGTYEYILAKLEGFLLLRR